MALMGWRGRRCGISQAHNGAESASSNDFRHIEFITAPKRATLSPLTKAAPHFSSRDFCSLSRTISPVEPDGFFASCAFLA
jgi:hypothetical protein